MRLKVELPTFPIATNLLRRELMADNSKLFPGRDTSSQGVAPPHYVDPPRMAEQHLRAP